MNAESPRGTRPPTLFERLALPAVALCLGLFVAGGGEAQSAEPAKPAEPDQGSARALTIGAGSVASRQVVAMGRDLEVQGEAAADVAAISGSVRVTGRVRGDVIVLGGDARLGSDAQVGGDVFVLGGELEAAPGARIDGRSVAYPTISSAWVILLGGPALGQSTMSPVVVGAKLALVAGWLAWTFLLFAVSGRELLSTSHGIAQEPFRNFFVGLTGTLAIFLTALLFSAFAAVFVGVPLLLLAVLIALLLKLWGMAAVFHALGDWVLGRFGKRWMPLNAALVGLCLLGVAKLVPWVGGWSWTVASLIGVGASLTTKFGRREPWFEASLRPSQALDARP